MERQIRLFDTDQTLIPSNGANGTGFSDPAFAVNKQSPIHRWVPWIAGFSKDFVRDSLERHLGDRQGTVLDPFSGVGTTLVESMMAGYNTVGFEINPYAALACKVKTTAHFIDLPLLHDEVAGFTTFCEECDDDEYHPTAKPPEHFKTRDAFYSPAVLRKVLTCLDYINSVKDAKISDLFRVAFAATMVRYSNYSYEPSLGRRVTSGKEEIIDYPVYKTIAAKLNEMAVDITWLRQNIKTANVYSWIINRSFFECREEVQGDSVDLVITSPPYLNNYHYNRNTRPQMFWLNLVQKPGDMKPLENQNFGKFWQTVREEERVDLNFSLPASDLHDRLEHLRTLHTDKGVYGGNGWANYAASYFNDCWKFSGCLQYVLKPGGTALVVIGNNILQGEMLPTDQYLGQIAQAVGLQLVEIHIPRATRVGSSIVNAAIRKGNSQSGQLYEAVVELRKL